ncbi:MAG: hypothetical protein KDM63_11020 [Verrucomicrobiae bacterium]|nr:hypothetical protein [Verrucomicrobiae bacterium]
MRKFQAWFIDEAQDVRTEANSRLAGSANQSDTSSGKLAEVDQRNIRYLDENEVEETMRRGMLGNEALARSFTKAVRDKIRGLFNTSSKEPLSFHKLHEYLMRPDGGLKDILIDTAKSQSKQDHAVATRESNLSPVMGLHIIKELFKDYGGEVGGSLRNVVNNIMAKAKASLRLDQSADQPRNVTGQLNMPRQPQRSYVVFMPTCRDHAAFRGALGEAFRKSVGEGVDVQVVDVDEAVNCSDIVIVTNTFWFSPRFVGIARTLKNKHLLPQVSSGGYKERWKLYLEDHQPGVIPDLLLPDDKEKVELSRADLVLADVLGKLEVFADEQEVNYLRYVERDADGRLRREVDAHTNRVNDEGWIDFGLEVRVAHETEAAELVEAGIPMTVTQAVLLDDFDRRFRSDSFFRFRGKAAALVAEHCGQRKKRDEVVDKLKQYRKTLFDARKRELGRAPDNDELFKKWDVAIEIARQRVESATK